MGLQTTGAISLNDIAGEFGGTTPHSLSEYYGVATGIPSSGTISFSQFYGKSNTVTAGVIADLAVIGGGGYNGGYAGGGGAGGVVWYSNGSGTNGSTTNTSLNSYRGHIDNAGILEPGTYTVTIGGASGDTTLTFPSGKQIIAIGGGDVAYNTTYIHGGSGAGASICANSYRGGPTTTGTKDYDGTSNKLQGYYGGYSQCFSGVAAASAGGGAGGNATNSWGADGTYNAPAVGPGIYIGGAYFAVGGAGMAWSPGQYGNYGSGGGYGGAVVFNFVSGGNYTITSSGTFTLSSSGVIS